MTYAVASILSKEFTCIPEILSRYFGKFYNNALSNGCTWLFIIWYVLHSGIDYALNELFRQMKYKEYNRTRLKYSLWYLGFYSTSFIYTGAILFQNSVDVFGFRRLHTSTYTDASSDLVLGFMILLTFFLHSAFWELLKYGSKSMFLSYLLLCLVLLISFILRILEVAFTLVAFISVTQVSIESAKLLYIVTNQDSSYYIRIVVSVFFGLSICSFVLSYLFGVPLVFLIPFGRNIISARFPVGYFFFTLLIGGWFISEVLNSPIFKLITHWLFHTERSIEICEDLVECSLFPPRVDIAYNLQLLRKEMRQREERKKDLRIESKKGMLMQTIKCMVTLKRKLNAKRAAAEKSAAKDSGNNTDHCELTNDEVGCENRRLLDDTDHTGDSVDNVEVGLSSVHHNADQKSEKDDDAEKKAEELENNVIERSENCNESEINPHPVSKSIITCAEDNVPDNDTREYQ